MARPLAMALLGAGVLAAPVPVLAQSVPAPAAAASAENLTLGRKLAQITNSEAMTAIQVANMVRNTLPPFFESDPDMQALEKDYPGVTKKLLEAAEPVLRDEVLRTLPALWDRLAVLYGSRLTAAELHEVIAFYSGDIGGRLIAASNGALDAAPLIKEAAESPEGTLSKSGVTSTITSGAKNMLANLSPADRDAVMRFSATPTGRRFNALLPELIAVATNWANEPNPEMDAKLEKLMTDVVEKIVKMESTK